MDLKRFKTLFCEERIQKFIIEKCTLPEELAEFLKNLSPSSIFSISLWLADQIDLRNDKSKNPSEVHASVIALEEILRRYLIPNSGLQFDEEFGEKIFSLIKEDKENSPFLVIGRYGVYALASALSHFQENLREKIAAKIMALIFHPDFDVRETVQNYILIEEIRGKIGKEIKTALAILSAACMPEEKPYFTIKESMEMRLARLIIGPGVGIWNIKEKIKEILARDLRGNPALEILGLRLSKPFPEIFASQKERDFLETIIEVIEEAEAPDDFGKFIEANEISETLDRLLPFLEDWALKAELSRIGMSPLAELLFSSDESQIEKAVGELEELIDSEEIVLKGRAWGLIYTTIDYLLCMSHYLGWAIAKGELNLEWDTEKQRIAEAIAKLGKIEGARAHIYLASTQPEILRLFPNQEDLCWLKSTAELAYSIIIPYA
jgi:hypothetical protein